MASRPEARRDRRRLAAWIVAAFALSAIRDPALLAAAGIGVAVLFRRGLRRPLRRTLRTVLPAAAGLSVASVLLLRILGGGWPAPQPFVAVTLRALVLALLTFAVLERVDLLRALAPYPLPSRLLAVTLAQIHALRRVATESREGLASRLPRRPSPLDLLRNAGGITATLLALADRNAREIGDAMRARGF